ncbi:MAG TPA: WYL domain-containing protein, partial [Trebonia sp.]
DARTRPGSFDPPAGIDPAARVLSGLASAPYRHQVTLRIRGTTEQVRARFPASIATITAPAAPIVPIAPAAPADPIAPTTPADPETGHWLTLELRAESLDWLPRLLASLDLPFVIDRPAELRDLVIALADRLAASARRTTVDD